MCCDGTLYARASSSTEEEVAYRAEGFYFVNLADQVYFTLPCTKLCGTVCSIYGNRPQVCGTFRCALLRNVEEKTTDLAAALDHVAKAKMLRDAAVAVAPEVATTALREAARNRAAEQFASADPEQRAQAAHRLLPIIALDEYLAHWFRLKKDQPASSGSND